MSDFDKEVEEFFASYQDRGMVKWAGFYLSDHTQKIEKEAYDNSIVEVRHPQETLELISQKLFESFSQQISVILQLKQIDVRGDFSKSISGVVEGFEDDSIFIKGLSINLEDICNVEIY